MTAITTTDRSKASDAKPLAKQMAKARKDLVAAFETHHGMSASEAVAKVHEFDKAEYAEHILKQPLSSTTWTDMDQIAAVDPDVAADRWNAIVDESREGWESGHRAADALEVSELTCTSRAEYIALREHLAADWHPKTGIELTLIDAMAEAYTLKLFWIKRMLALDALEQSSGVKPKLGLPTVTSFQATEQAATMVDRFDRMFMRAVRQLRDLRRYVSTVVVQNAGQVNVGQQQVNVNDEKAQAR